jgi:hypothetical protein
VHLARLTAPRNLSHWDLAVSPISRSMTSRLCTETIPDQACSDRLYQLSGRCQSWRQFSVSTSTFLLSSLFQTQGRNQGAITSHFSTVPNPLEPVHWPCGIILRYLTNLLNVKTDFQIYRLVSFTLDPFLIMASTSPRSVFCWNILTSPVVIGLYSNFFLDLPS